MNRLVLIGNGFDIAHGLKTSYANFISWYWSEWGKRLLHGQNKIEEDGLCSFNLKEATGYSAWAMIWGWYYRRTNPLVPWDVNEIVEHAKQDRSLCDFSMCSFLEKICKSIETKKWVDIENKYYRLLTEYALKEEDEEKVKNLNQQLQLIQDKLTEYLKQINENPIKPISEIRSKIYAPFKKSDFSNGGLKTLAEHVKAGLALDNKEMDYKLRQYDSSCYTSGFVDDYRKKHPDSDEIDWECVPIELLLPNQIMLLNFNYTNTAQSYCKAGSRFTVNHIHGKVEEPKSIIFGYGDELDKDYQKLKEQIDNEVLHHIKSIRYHEADNCHQMLDFIESEQYQVVIMGHSCGISDRTLLSTLFEHKNCVSIKPYFYIKEDGSDNYLELIQNISRNFTDMKLMRDRVVNKTFTEPLI